MKYQKGLARVEDIKLKMDGVLMLNIELAKEDGFHQCFGTYQLSHYDKKLDRQVGSAQGLDYIIQILDVFDVDSLEKIKGKMCYALYEEPYQPFNSLIRGIQSLDIDGGKKFTIHDWVKQWGLDKEEKGTTEYPKGDLK